MSVPARPDAAVRLAIVGAGPRAVMLLERVVARLARLARLVEEGVQPAPALEITLVDPHPPGAGRIWRRDQSPLLKLNSMARDVTVFTDETSTIEGPVRPGPSLIEWIEQVRTGTVDDPVLAEALAQDAAVADELARLRGEDFPTRRLQSHYLDWFWRTTVAAAPAGVHVRWQRGTVTGVERAGESGGEPDREPAAAPDQASGPHTVRLADGDAITADVVVYAVGHNGREPAAPTQQLIDDAASAGLVYVAPAFTADADLSALGAGDDVIVRGLGLAAVDAIVLLAEGRGGRFVPRPDGGLRYEASGREPRLHVGSRRGVPYRSKVGSAIQGTAPVLEVLTPDAVAELVARPGPVDFTRDVWPLIARELVFAHYRELFTGHPERVLVPWAQFRETLREVAGDTDALRRAAARVVPDPLDRFDVPALDRPLAGETFAHAEELQGRLRQHIRDDLTLRTDPAHSSSQSVFLGLLLSFLALADVPTERWSARSRAETLPVQWHTFFSYVASGPPAHRLEELLALADAGVVRFLGPDVSVRIDPARGFVASSPAVPGEFVARALVDAWLPGSGAAVSDNAALRELALVHGRELRVADAEFSGSLGRIEVDDLGRVVDPDGSAHADVFAIGPFTSATEAGAFTRPRSDSLSLRQTDRIAAAVVAAVGAAGAARADLGAARADLGARARAARADHADRASSVLEPA